MVILGMLTITITKNNDDVSLLVILLLLLLLFFAQMDVLLLIPISFLQPSFYNLVFRLCVTPCEANNHPISKWRSMLMITIE